MKKYTKITEQNICLIYQRFVKFFERNKYVSEQTDWGSLPKLKNRLGIKPFKEIPNAKAIEASNKSYLFYDNTSKGIDIHLFLNANDSSIDIIEESFVKSINVGDLIKIDSKEIKLKSRNIMGVEENKKYLTIFKCSNESDYNAYVEDMLFWEHASADWQDDICDEIFQESLKRKIEENDNRVCLGIKELDDIAKQGFKIEDVTKLFYEKNTKFSNSSKL